MTAPEARSGARTRLVVRGAVRVPGDKSISHRALLLAALGDGPSRLRGILRSADIEATRTILRHLGVPVPELGPAMVVPGVGLRGLRAPDSDLDCANSGTSCRLLAGVVAGAGLDARFIGDESLGRRPMRRVAEPLRAMGAAVELGEGDRLPMRVRGPVRREVRWTSAIASAQVKGCVLLAGLVGGVRVRVEEPARSRDHTERMLRARGVPVEIEGLAVSITPPVMLPAADVDVPGDPSSAAFLAGLAALADDGDLLLRGLSVNPGRIGFFTVLQRMGARVEIGPSLGDDPVADVRVAPGRLRATTVDAAEVPALIDELPLLACLAARADGVTEVHGAAELRAKESDRITAVVTNLRAIGVEAEELPDGFVVCGSDRPLRGTVRTHGDYRLAMAFGVLGTVPGNDVTVDEPECVAVSYPEFWGQLRTVVG
jgi:3-phosphoshikimate 1-carboxyvinyltransferase